MLNIVSKACPIGIHNAYGEVLTRECAEKIVRQGPVPMYMDHDEEHQIGTWNHFHIADGWIWAQGQMHGDTEWARTAQYAVKNGKRKEVSVSFWLSTVSSLKRDNRFLYDVTETGAGIYKPLRLTPDIFRGLAELSIVDSGAYFGTEIHWSEAK